MIGEDLERFAVLGHDALAYLANALADLLGGDDPQLATRKLLDQHRGAGGIA